MSESVEVVRQKEIVKRMRELNSKVIAERDALAAELAACKTARDGWTRASDAAHARIRVLESALTEVKAVLRETHGGRHYEPECPECVWLDGATALETEAEHG